MKKITQQDKLLIKQVFEQLDKNNTYDNAPFSDKACVVCAESKKTYAGINLSLWFGACAETIAIGSAIANGERKLSTIVSAGFINDKKEVITPCGNCRQLMARHCPEVDIIINDNGKYIKVKPEELLPFSFTSTTVAEKKGK